jgi:hypothetical protein
MLQQSIIYDLLLAPRFRLLRHFGLFLFFTIVSVNQALVGYADIYSDLGSKIYLIVAGTILTYIVMMYITLYVFIPRYLFTGKYMQFVLCIILIAFIFEIIPNTVFIIYHKDYDILSEVAVIDNISSYVIYLLCISGVIIPVFLRRWIISNQRLNQLKKKQMVSEVEQLKEQINPDSFFKILDKTNSLVKTAPGKASAMLMKLSQLLRYQLYDCNRDKVLLATEISFLRNFLELENMYSVQFTYTIYTSGNINTTFVPPSILLPYIQSVLKVSDKRGEGKNLDIYIEDGNKEIVVLLKVPGLNNSELLKNELKKIENRLRALYHGHYELTVAEDKGIRGIEVCLNLDKE